MRQGKYTTEAGDRKGQRRCKPKARSADASNRYADPDLTLAQVYRVGHQTIEPDQRQDQPKIPSPAMA
jgi:hypothetical protein